jgi:type IV secretion system protein VirB11
MQMAQAGQENETSSRRSAMLRTAFCPVVRQALEQDDTIEIMANPDGSVWIERHGRGLVLSEHRLEANDRERVIRLAASGAGDTVSHTSPIVSAELPGSGERFEGLLPPISLAPCFSIRKPARVVSSLDTYVGRDTLSPTLALALRAAIEARENIVIAGGTSSGKTSFANALLAEPSLADDRIVILEDTRELACCAPNCIQLRTYDGKVSLQRLVRSTLRLRPDRIIVGEVRGAEALDLLKAWNTDHPGGITTLHANSATSALRRLEQLTLEAARQIPFDLILEAVNIVVFMSRKDGVRRIEDAIRITGFDGEGYVTEPLVPRSPSLVSCRDNT